ncbi:MAG TPA: DUF433 domain-containing protein [Candidatus Paceibacterota bacterium]|nr:DUF433 domain-containing protein [Verrucomicrobiota bacterium]HRY51390.1 DUF433 domain-containing protein [Candidatus Paceibacterota bacterium]HSA00119.1 DUF433 domain-containing protein [Candidatus Paceibacterota bacterium]
MVDPQVFNGHPGVRGTRITDQTILEFLGAGDFIQDVLEEYPSLSGRSALGHSSVDSDRLINL